jgi:hypothetical protein
VYRTEDVSGARVDTSPAAPPWFCRRRVVSSARRCLNAVRLIFVYVYDIRPQRKSMMHEDDERSRDNHGARIREGVRVS